MIGKLCLTLGSTAKSVVKTVAAQQKTLDSLAKVVLNNRLALFFYFGFRRVKCHMVCQILKIKVGQKYHLGIIVIK